MGKPSNPRRSDTCIFTSSHLILALTVMGCSTTGQYFDPELDDQTYLNNLQKKLEIEVNATRVRLVEQAKLTEMIAKEFVSAQIKENLFIALRVIAEKELMQLKDHKGSPSLSRTETDKLPLPTPTQLARQEDSEEDSGLYPQVSSLIKAIFGQSSAQPNITNYLTLATTSANKPVSKQVVGLVNAIMGQNSVEPVVSAPVNLATTRKPVANPTRVKQRPSKYKLRPQSQSQGQLGQLGSIGDNNRQPFPSKSSTNTNIGIQGNGLLDPRPSSITTNQGQNNQQILEQILSNPSGGQAFPGNNVHNPNRLDPAQVAALESLLEQYHATEYGPPKESSISGGVFGGQIGNTGGGVIGIKGTSKPYIYQPTGVGGIGSSSAAYKPPRPAFPGGGDASSLQQQIQHLLNQQQAQGGPQFGGRPPGGGQFGQGPLGQGQGLPPGGEDFLSSTVKPSEEDEDEDEDEDARKLRENKPRVRQFTFGGLLNIFRTTPRPQPITPGPVTQPPSSSVQVIVDGQSIVVESAPPPAPIPAQPLATNPTTPQPFNFATFSQTVGKNFADIVKIMPSLLMGARQGVQLIQTISSLFGGLDAIGDLAGGIL